MHSELTVLFGTPLWAFQVRDHKSINDRLEGLVENEMASDPGGVSYSNRGGWQSIGDLHIRPEYRFFIDVIGINLRKAAHAYGFGKSAAKMMIGSMWANVNGEGNSNDLHSHQSPAGSPVQVVLSGAYYVRVPAGSGAFIAEDYSHPQRYLRHPFENANPLNSYSMRIRPEEGRMLFFPSWMLHGVEQSSCDEKRISIAFNITLRLQVDGIDRSPDQ